MNRTDSGDRLERENKELRAALTEPSCFCHVDGCRKAGGANMAVGDEAALCGLLASIASSGSPLMRP